jgi:hypothetical protein
VNYTPLGPWLDPGLVGIDVIVNGEVRAKSGSFNLPSSVVDCLVYVTSWLSAGSGGCPTLLPNAGSERGYLVFLQVVRERPVCFPVNGA